MLTFKGSPAKFKGWVQYCGFEGQWPDDQHFECTNGAKLVWSSKTGEIRYEGDAKAVKELKHGLNPNKRAKPLLIFLWLAVSVAVPLLPLGATYINGRTSGSPPGLIELLARGELFLIATALTADGIGRALLGGERNKGLRIICGIGCVLLLAATTLYFGRIAFSDEEKRSALISSIQKRDLDQAKQALNLGVDRKVIAGDSLWLFGLSVAASFGIILVQEE